VGDGWKMKAAMDGRKMKFMSEEKLETGGGL
jgi:hypothetical protein